MVVVVSLDATCGMIKVVRVVVVGCELARDDVVVYGCVYVVVVVLRSSAIRNCNRLLCV